MYSTYCSLPLGPPWPIRSVHRELKRHPKSRTGMLLNLEHLGLERDEMFPVEFKVALAEAASSTADLDRLRAEGRALQEKLQSKNFDLFHERAGKALLADKVQSLEQVAEMRDQKLLEAVSLIEELKAQRDGLQTEQGALRSKLLCQEFDLTHAFATRAILSDRVNDLQAEGEKLNTALADACSSITELEGKTTNLETPLAAVRKEERTLRTSQAELKSKATFGGGAKEGSSLSLLIPRARTFLEASRGHRNFQNEELDGGESVAEIVRAKPTNSCPRRPLEQVSAPETTSSSAKRGAKEESEPSKGQAEAADVSQEQKARQQENSNKAHAYAQKASREHRSERQSDRASSREGTDRASTAPHGLPTDRDWTWSDFKVGREVGVGRYSTVYQAEVWSTQFPVALKMYHKKKMDNYVANQVRREIRLHMRVPHKHISELYGFFEDKEGNICLVLEWAPLGDVYGDRRKSKGPLSEERTVKEVVQPLMFALQYMHKQGIIHRDIKPENILVFPNKQIKLADFGFAIDLNEQRPCTRLGTTDYMAPEIIAVDDKHRDCEKGNYGAGVDAWAVGIVVYELLTGRPPFQADSRKETFALIQKGDFVIPSYLSTEAASFILTALTRNPHQRPTVMQLLHHPWILKHGVRSSQRQS